MKNCAFLPQLDQDQPSIRTNESNSRQVHQGACPLLRYERSPGMLQFLHPGTGETAFQLEPDNGTRPVYCDPQHDTTTGSESESGLTPQPCCHDAFLARLSCCCL